MVAHGVQSVIVFEVNTKLVLMAQKVSQQHDIKREWGLFVTMGGK